MVLLAHGEQQIIQAVVQQGLVRQGAGGHHPHHLPVHWSLAGGWIADLFGDGHGYTGFHQSGQVALGGVVGYAAHGNGFPRGLAPGGEGDIQQLCGLPGVVVEQLVEITHAVEQQVAGVLRLDAQELLHHRRVISNYLF